MQLVRIALILLITGPISAATLNITVKDPSGALVSQAGVIVTPPQGAPAQSRNTDAHGRVAFDLPAGHYGVSVTRAGFEPAERDAALENPSLDLTVNLTLAATSTTMRISGKRSPLANSDPNYQALRKGRLTQVYRVSNFTLTRDVGTFNFRAGAFSFLPPVLGHVTTGVFVGDGNFTLDPAIKLAANHLHHMMGADAVDEDFTALVVYFSDATFDEVKKNGQLADESTQRQEDALKRVKELIETRREPNLLTRQLTMLERLLAFEDIPNYEAEVLEELYNRENPGSFRAFIRGKKYPDLRFLLNPHGAMPMLPAPEEVALLDFDPNSFSDGVWYLSHFASELRTDRANSSEDKRLIAPEHYKLDTLIRRENALGNIPDLAVTCEMRFRALQDKVRMVKFDMVPDLQVARVTFKGNDIPFVQEGRSQDGSFYLQMPEPLVKDRTYTVAFEYSGGEIVQSRYPRFTIPSSRIWYPTPAGPSSRATYDMTFRIPYSDHLVATGELTRQSRESGYATSEWVSNQPIAQAVFRYTTDEEASSKSEIEPTTNTPMTAMVATGGRGILPPSLKNILLATGNSMRVFNQWFGKPGSPNITVLVGSGYDSLPSLVLVQSAAIIGFTAVYSQSLVASRGRGGGRPLSRPAFDEAFPILMSKQWWGCTVSPVSVHDAWLTEGLASFSGSLFDTAAGDFDNYKGHWTQGREFLLASNPLWAGKANDIGPLWLGILNETGETPRAGAILDSWKGGFIIQMLRSLFWDPRTGDADFHAMLKDFLQQFKNRAVSSEDFEAVVEKHMKPVMDLGHNHSMGWFFSEWLLTTEIPSYRLEYSLTPQQGGKVVVTGKLTQSGVSPDFKMLVPVFGEFSGRKERILVAALAGSSSGEFRVMLDRMPKHILLNINHDILTYKDEVVQLKK